MIFRQLQRRASSVTRKSRSSTSDLPHNLILRSIPT